MIIILLLCSIVKSEWAGYIRLANSVNYYNITQNIQSEITKQRFFNHISDICYVMPNITCLGLDLFMVFDEDYPIEDAINITRHSNTTASIFITNSTVFWPLDMSVFTLSLENG